MGLTQRSSIKSAIENMELWCWWRRSKTICLEDTLPWNGKETMVIKVTISQHSFSVLTKTQLINASIRKKLFIVKKNMDPHLEMVMISTFPPIVIKMTLQVLNLVLHSNYLTLINPMNLKVILLVHKTLQLLITVCCNWFDE